MKEVEPKSWYFGSSIGWKITRSDLSFISHRVLSELFSPNAHPDVDERSPLHLFLQLKECTLILSNECSSPANVSHATCEKVREEDRFFFLLCFEWVCLSTDHLQFCNADVEVRSEEMDNNPPDVSSALQLTENSTRKQILTRIYYSVKIQRRMQKLFLVKRLEASLKVTKGQGGR